MARGSVALTNITKASIDYMRYLEQCIGDLRNAHQKRRDSPASTDSEPSLSPKLRILHDDGNEDEDDEDEQMEDVVSPTRAEHTLPQSGHHFTNTSSAMPSSDRSIYAHSSAASPVIIPHDRGQYSVNPSPTLYPSDPHHYSLAPSSVHSSVASPSIQPSPAFGGVTPSATQFSNPFGAAPLGITSSAASGSSHGARSFALTSPALGPQADREDQEATEALMMLNTDRRKWSMSVKDLLSG